MMSVTDPRTRPAREASSLRTKLSPPAIVLGGGANALSVARCLAKRGVKVYAINEPGAFVRYSRYCRLLKVESTGDLEESWARFLLGPESDHLRGAVLLSCSDSGIQLIAQHREALERRFLLDDSNRDAQRRMLDKLSTYEEARAADVPTPGFWVAETREQVLALRDRLPFPVLVKPRLSHLFEERYGKKFIVAANFDEVLEAFDAISESGIEVLLMELIPGGDDRLCSYYTYIDENGRPLFHFTKRVIRRNPIGMGMGCYHITDWDPEVAELGLRLCTRAGLRGIANVEFKRDARDGELKLIECNARFTASNCLVARSGLDIPTFVYNRIVGLPLPATDNYTRGMRLWDPIRDFESFLELRRRGELTLAGWLRSVLHRQNFAYFDWSDPLPALARALKPLARRLARLRPGRWRATGSVSR